MRLRRSAPSALEDTIHPDANDYADDDGRQKQRDESLVRHDSGPLVQTEPHVSSHRGDKADRAGHRSLQHAFHHAGWIVRFAHENLITMLDAIPILDVRDVDRALRFYLE